MVKNGKSKVKNKFKKEIISFLKNRKGKSFSRKEISKALGVRKSNVSKAVSFPSLIQVVRGYLRLVSDIYRKKRIGELSYSKDSMTFERKSNFSSKSVI